MQFKKLAKIFKALSCETRLRILWEILANPKCGIDISQCLNRDLSTISRHIKILENAGLIKTYRDGKYVKIEIKNKENLIKVFELLGGDKNEFV